MLERAWLGMILVFIGGWIGVWLWPGSEIAGVAVYATTAGLICIAVAALARPVLRRRHR